MRKLTDDEISSLAPMVEQVKAYAENLKTDDAFADGTVLVDPETGEVIEPLK